MDGAVGWLHALVTTNRYTIISHPQTSHCGHVTSADSVRLHAYGSQNVVSSMIDGRPCPKSCNLGHSPLSDLTEDVPPKLKDKRENESTVPTIRLDNVHGILLTPLRSIVGDVLHSRSRSLSSVDLEGFGPLFTSFRIDPLFRTRPSFLS
jgi:hypothetical protein